MFCVNPVVLYNFKFLHEHVRSSEQSHKMSEKLLHSSMLKLKVGFSVPAFCNKYTFLCYYLHLAI